MFAATVATMCARDACLITAERIAVYLLLPKQKLKKNEERTAPKGRPHKAEPSHHCSNCVSNAYVYAHRTKIVQNSRRLLARGADLLPNPLPLQNMLFF